MFPIAQLVSFIPLLAVAFYLHPIHVSVTEVDFDKKEQSLQIMMRVFIEDLETTLRNARKDPELDILEPAGGQTTDSLAEAYLKEHFKISLDGRPQKMKYLGHEREADAFIFYIEVSNVKPWRTISVVNDIIMSTYSDQSNLVHVYVDDNVKSLRLTTNTPADHLTFDNQ
jgi:hypothetical protein